MKCMFKRHLAALLLSGMFLLGLLVDYGCRLTDWYEIQTLNRQIRVINHQRQQMRTKINDDLLTNGQNDPSIGANNLKTNLLTQEAQATVKTLWQLRGQPHAKLKSYQKILTPQLAQHWYNLPTIKLTKLTTTVGVLQGDRVRGVIVGKQKGQLQMYQFQYSIGQKRIVQIHAIKAKG